MCQRNENLVRYAETNGTLAPFARVYIAVFGKEPENVQEAFAAFVSEMMYVEERGVHPNVFNLFKKRYNGGRVRYYRGNGVAMVLNRRRAVAFFPEIALWTGSLKRKGGNIPAPSTRTFRGVDTPRGANTYRAALAAQLPSRGRGTPDSKI